MVISCEVRRPYFLCCQASESPNTLSLKYRESSSHSKDIFRKGEWAKVSRAPFFPPGVLPGKLGEFFSSRVCLRNTCLFVLWGARMTVQSAQIPAQRATDPPIWCKMSSANQLKAKFVAEKETSVVNRWEKAVRTRDRVSVRSEVKKDSSTGFERSSVAVRSKRTPPSTWNAASSPRRSKRTKDSASSSLISPNESSPIVNGPCQHLEVFPDKGRPVRPTHCNEAAVFTPVSGYIRPLTPQKPGGGGREKWCVFDTQNVCQTKCAPFSGNSAPPGLAGAPAVANNPNLEKALRPVTNEEYDSNSLKRSKFSVCQKQNSFTVWTLYYANIMQWNFGHLKQKIVTFIFGSFAKTHFNKTMCSVTSLFCSYKQIWPF